MPVTARPLGLEISVQNKTLRRPDDFMVYTFEDTFTDKISLSTSPSIFNKKR